MKAWPLIALLLLAACQVTPKASPIALADFETLGFKSDPAKVSVVRVIRPDCAYCEIDLRRLANLFRSGFIDADFVTLFLVVAEDKPKFEEFLRGEFKSYRLPVATQIKFVELPAPIKSEINQIPFGFLYDENRKLIEQGPIGPTQKQIRESYKNLAHLTHPEG